MGDLTGTVRKVVLFGVDEQPWEKTAEALRGGLKADGQVTLLLERPSEGSPYATWTAVEDKRATQAREVRACCGVPPPTSEWQSRLRLSTRTPAWAAAVRSHGSGREAASVEV